MNVKIFYRITQDRAGIPMDYAGARRFDAQDLEQAAEAARSELAQDYQVPVSAVEISRIEH